jgi:hypothetical protein
MKRLVRELTEQKVKPSRILNRLIGDFHLGQNDVIGLLTQVQRYSSYYRTTSLNDSDWVDVMRQLATDNRFSADLGDDTGSSFGYDEDNDGNPLLGDGSEENPLLIGFATKVTLRSLSFASAWIVHIDATYKTNTCGYPVIVIGVSDAWRQFHPVAFLISSDARQVQYERRYVQWLSCTSS